MRLRTHTATLILLSGTVFLAATGKPVYGQQSKNGLSKSHIIEKSYDEMTSAELTKAQRVAETADIRPLVACADPGNLPMSDINGEGYDNKIVKLLAKSLNTSVSFFWRLYLERGLNRETFSNKECDLLLGMPYNYEGVLTTMPIYRSTYVFAYREDESLSLTGLDDTKLAKMRIGTYQHSGLREALTRKGVAEDIRIHAIRQDTDLTPEHQQWQQVKKLGTGELDLVGIWGPFAGYAQKVRNLPIRLLPVNLMEDKTPLEFSLSIGMRKNDVTLKFALDKALKENAEELESILRSYGVPLVSCSQCAVQGDLPSHGSYYEGFIDEAESRFLKPLTQKQTQLDKEKATADQIVDINRLNNWLKQGADLNKELANAVLAADKDRIRFLLDQGADINFTNAAGYNLLHDAARFRDSDTLGMLLSLGADPNLADPQGWTPLMHGAYRNHVPTVEVLAAAKADLERRTNNGYTALALAIGERKFWATDALIKAGADVNSVSGEKHLTPLMLVALHVKSNKRQQHVIEGAEPGEIATRLIEAGALLNAKNSEGETPLMFAAAHDNSAMIALLVKHGADVLAVSNSGSTALDIANENRALNASKALKLFTMIAEKKLAKRKAEQDGEKTQ